MPVARRGVRREPRRGAPRRRPRPPPGRPTPSRTRPGAALLILIPAYHAGSRVRPVRLPPHVRRGRRRLPAARSRSSSRRRGIAAAHARLARRRPRARASSARGTSGWPPSRRERAGPRRPRGHRAHRSACRTSPAQMSTGLDAPASATLALDLLAAEVPSTRSAVLVTRGRRAPRARGAARVDARAVGASRTRWPRCSAAARRGGRPTEVTLHRRPRATRAPSSCPGAGQRVDDCARRRSGRRHRPSPCEERRVRRRRSPGGSPPRIQAGLLFGTLRQVRQHRGARPDRPRHPRRHRPGARRARLPGRRPAGTGRSPGTGAARQPRRPPGRS